MSSFLKYFRLTKKAKKLASDHNIVF
jgi:hypothetical protein